MSNRIYSSNRHRKPLDLRQRIALRDPSAVPGDGPARAPLIITALLIVAWVLHLYRFI